jgi:threonyl-tRNA synthetase
MRDHVELGKALDLFHQSPLVGKGLPLLTPRGTDVLRVMKRFIEDEELSRGYQFTTTPSLASAELFKVSGHWDLYRDSMFLIPDGEGDGLALRPMTCPFQFQIYNRKVHSWRELPVRLAETSTLFRNEASGALHGLVRIRQFTLSEGHIICRPDQVEQEFLDALALVRYVMAAVGIGEFWYRFSRWDPANKAKYIDDPAAWDASEATLRALLEKTGESYVEAPGEAAFYGPKLDIQVKDAWGRDETLFTLQLDFALPGRFDMAYIDKDGSRQRPLVIHRSSIGCYERTLALLLELHQGRLPFWLAPEQVRILAVGDQAGPAVAGLRQGLVREGIRCSVDDRSESLGRKIQDARGLEIPLVAVVGAQEAAAGSVGWRTLTGDRGQTEVQAFTSACGRADRDRRFEVPLKAEVALEKGSS